MYVIPMFIAKFPSNGGNLCSSIDESSHPNVSYKNISFVYPPNWLYGGLWAMILETGNNSYWLEIGTGASTGSAFCLGVEGSSAVTPQCWTLKVLGSGCWSTHVMYAPNPGSYSIGPGFDHSPGLILIASGRVIIAVTTLPSGPWAIAAGILIVISLTPVGSLLLGFL